MPRVEAVLFDVNETLVGLAPVRDAFAEVGLDPARMDAWFRGVLLDGVGAAAAGTFATFPEIARHLLGDELAAADLPVGEGREDRVIDAFATLGVHADVAPALERLQRAGVPARTLTNGSSGVGEGALERAGLLDLVAERWDVGAARRWKPAPEPYLWAAHQLGVAPERVALVAVHPWDVHGASVAGLQGVWVDRAGTDRYPPYLEPPVVRGHDLDEAVAALL